MVWQELRRWLILEFLVLMLIFVVCQELRRWLIHEFLILILVNNFSCYLYLSLCTKCRRLIEGLWCLTPHSTIFQTTKNHESWYSRNEHLANNLFSYLYISLCTIFRGLIKLNEVAKIPPPQLGFLFSF